VRGIFVKNNEMVPSITIGSTIIIISIDRTKRKRKFSIITITSSSALSENNGGQKSQAIKLRVIHFLELTQHPLLSLFPLESSKIKLNKNPSTKKKNLIIDYNTITTNLVMISLRNNRKICFDFLIMLVNHHPQ
jgi:hypothetical protein